MVRPACMAAVALIALTACTVEQARLGDGTPSLKTAQTALSSGAPDLAYRICAALVDHGDRSTQTLVCKGNALTGLGRSAEAASVFAVALQGAPHNTDALIGTGRLRLATDPAGAEQIFMQALAVSPRDAVALNDLGIARDLQGRHHDAQIAYAEAIGANPDARAPQVNLALSMAMSGRASEGARMLRPLAENDTATVRERHDYAAVLTMAGRPDEATQFLSPELTGPQAEQAVSAYRTMPSNGTPLATAVDRAPPIALAVSTPSPSPAPVPVAALTPVAPITLTPPAVETAAPAPVAALTPAKPITLVPPPAIVESASAAIFAAPSPGPEASPPNAAEAEATPIKLTPVPDVPVSPPAKVP